MGMLFQSIKIEDARGRRMEFKVEPDSPDLKAVLEKDDYRLFNRVYQDDVLGFDLLDIKKRRPFRNARFYIELLWIVMFGVLGAVLLAGLGYFIGVNTRLAAWGILLIVSILLTMIRLAAWKRWRLRSMNTQRPSVRMLLDLKCCPACMYSLAGQEIESDGCTVCPECGGAWRVNRIEG